MYTNASVGFECSLCPRLEEPNTNHSGCVACPAGTVWNTSTNGMCIFCPAGSEPDASRTSCISCLRNQYSNVSTMHTCTYCPEDHEPTGSLTECVACSSYTFYNSSTDFMCRNCPAGEGPTSSRNACMQCTVGMYSNASTLFTCKSCDPGTQPGVDRAFCESCSVNEYSNGSTGFVCQHCPPGWQSDAVLQSCERCLMQEFSNSSTGFLCQPCPSGQVPSPSGAKCVFCPVNQFTNASTNFLCTVCPDGYEPSNGQHRCTACDLNKYSNSASDFLCSTCASGYEPTAAQSNCTQCAPNMFSDSSTNYTCRTCSLGSEPSANRSSCSSCSAGMYSNSSTGFMCKFCLPGTMSVSRGSACETCDQNAYSNASTGFTCVSCPPGHMANQGKTGCEICGPGHFSNASTGFMCQMCGPGMEPSMYRDRCNRCPTGYHSSNFSNFQCMECPPGFEPSPSAENCTVCPPRSISNRSTNHTCLACPYPTTTTQHGSSSCDACEVSFYGTSCSLFCEAYSNCSGRGNCSFSAELQTVACECLSGWKGADCSQRIVVPPSSVVPPVPGIDNTVGSDAGQAAVSASVAAAGASGASMLQLFDALQTVIRMGCMKVEFPIWYIYFVQGLSLPMMNFRLEFLMAPLESARVIQPPDDGDVDLYNDSNMRIYYMEGMGVYSAIFITTFVNVCFLLMVLASVHATALTLFSAVFYGRLRWLSRGSSLVQVSESPRLAHKFWLFFRGVYFDMFYAFSYSIFCACLVQLFGFSGVRPVWESAMAVVVLLFYIFLSIYWVVPMTRETIHEGEDTSLWHKMDFGVHEFHPEYWWAHPATLGIFFFDALLVSAGACFPEYVSFDFQLTAILTASMLRSVFLLSYFPCHEVTANIKHVLVSVSDSFLLLLIYSMQGRSRDSAWNGSCAFIIGLVQMIVVIITFVFSIIEMLIAAAAFASYLKQILVTVVVRRITMARARKAERAAAIRAKMMERDLGTSHLGEYESETFFAEGCLENFDNASGTNSKMCSTDGSVCQGELDSSMALGSQPVCYDSGSKVPKFSSSHPDILENTSSYPRRKQSAGAFATQDQWQIIASDTESTLTASSQTHSSDGADGESSVITSESKNAECLMETDSDPGSHSDSDSSSDVNGGRDSNGDHDDNDFVVLDASDWLSAAEANLKTSTLLSGTSPILPSAGEEHCFVPSFLSKTAKHMRKSSGTLLPGSGASGNGAQTSVSSQDSSDQRRVRFVRDAEHPAIALGLTRNPVADLSPSIPSTGSPLRSTGASTKTSAMDAGQEKDLFVQRTSASVPMSSSLSSASVNPLREASKGFVETVTSNALPFLSVPKPYSSVSSASMFHAVQSAQSAASTSEVPTWESVHAAHSDATTEKKKVQSNSNSESDDRNISKNKKNKKNKKTSSSTEKETTRAKACLNKEMALADMKATIAQQPREAADPANAINPLTHAAMLFPQSSPLSLKPQTSLPPLLGIPVVPRSLPTAVTSLRTQFLASDSAVVRVRPQVSPVTMASPASASFLSALELSNIQSFHSPDASIPSFDAGPFDAGPSSAKADRLALELDRSKSEKKPAKSKSVAKSPSKNKSASKRSP
eukprot:ANDGO_00361.mRNA.1 hypothetical protein